jgi:cytochrome b6-f complex iron-sulfur subunit
MTPTRRELLEAGWKVGGGLLLLAAGWTTWEALRPLAGGEGGGLFVLGDPEGFPDGSATWVREGRFFLTRSRGELFALSQRCPHLGCSVPFCDASGAFECPCHGTVFNVAGEWISGPSPRGMDRHPLRIEDGRVVVNTALLEQGPPLGSRAHDVPARDARCSGEGAG